MLSDALIEKFYCNKRIMKIPVVFIAEFLKALEEVLEKEREENPYGTISELFDE